MGETPGTFVGFGFGAIQGGLFLFEAFRSRNFRRLVVAEVMPDTVAAVRRAGGRYRLNVATGNGIEVHEVLGVEILNPTVPEDAERLIDALAEATEIATALPSVDFFARGKPSVASLIAAGLERKAASTSLPPCIIYTAENDNHAAEKLEQACQFHLNGGGAPVVQFLNTVIGKMSGIVSNPPQIASQGLSPVADGLPTAFLVEEFNRILISKIDLPKFRRGISAFVEKSDLLPFEEAKLYGHNAIHALLGYLANLKRLEFMSDIASDAKLIALGRGAFLEESGKTLIRKYEGLDPLFTEAGYAQYAEDLLVRMTNPFLRDRTDRIIRDTPRKLQWDDRLIGTMRLALDGGVRPVTFALGAAAAVSTLAPQPLDELFEELWNVADQPLGRKAELIGLIAEAQQKLTTQLN